MKREVAWRRAATALLVVLLAGVLPAGVLKAQQTPTGLLDSITYRNIGPTQQSGRFVDFAVPLQEPHIIYAATASGGLWKTVNRGRSFQSVLDDVDIISIGAVAVAPSDPNVLYLGTGEGNNSRSVYYGNGMYKSVDAGSTWVHLGLDETHHIGRIIVHPSDPNTVYAAAQGHLYSENPERGLYKTTDGGRTWTKVLEPMAEGRHIGVADVVMDPRRPNTLYASAYDKVRRPWTFNEAGPGSAIYKSTNAGRTWTKLEGGLPGGMIGRIGLTISPQNSNILYAVVENANSEGVPVEERRQELLEGRPPRVRIIGNEVYRTDDGGRTWRKVNERGQVGGSPPYYYGQIIIDPNDTEHVYNLGVSVTHSTDGGKTWQNAFRFGGDNHALWIDPADSRHMALGYDHGMGVTYDSGATWYHPDDLPLAQCYGIGVDMADPYNVACGLQDNGSVYGPSSLPGGGIIPFEAWQGVGGGDGMYNVIDPANNRYLYNESQFGPISRRDMVTGETRSIRYRGEGLRFNWCAPIFISPHDPDVIFHGANVLLRSAWRGESWEEISPDLTTADSSKIVGTGNIQYCTITTIDESPITPGALWVGTDDGNVQYSPDGGRTWTLMNDRIPDYPAYWVSRVTASSHEPGTAYVSCTGFRRDDFRPLLWMTTDAGETWTSIAANLPDEPINVIKEDQKNPNLLAVGTDRAVYVSLDRGRSWTQMRSNMPYVAVHDLVIHPRDGDLVVGTHGRGIFIADISPLRELTAAVLASDAHFFTVEPETRWIRGPRNETSAQNVTFAESEPRAMELEYYLRNTVETVTFRIYRGTRLVRELVVPEPESGSGGRPGAGARPGGFAGGGFGAAAPTGAATTAGNEAGLHTLLWDMQIKRPRTPQEKEQLERRGRGGQEGQAREMPAEFQRGGQRQAEDPENVLIAAPPDEYRIVMVVNGREYEQVGLIRYDYRFEK